MSSFYALLVPKKQAKFVKTELETSELLNKSIKIQTSETDTLTIPTSVPYNVASSQDPSRLLQSRLPPTLLDFGFEVSFVRVNEHIDAVGGSPLRVAIAQSLAKLPPEFLDCIATTSAELLRTLNGAFNIYEPMLLLPSVMFRQEPWRKFKDEIHNHPSTCQAFFASLALKMCVTHIALNAPITALNSASGHDVEGNENVVRSPTNLTPLYGCFGANLPPPPHYLPSFEDLKAAFWVSTRQNGIKQTWAPRYTMFSAGNVTEKARMLHLASVKQAVTEGRENEHGSAAVDLFAGIGYFAFSYAKAGIDQVLCWDLNPWSLEGLQRGAAENGWTSFLVDTKGGRTVAVAERIDGRFLLFNESNVNAAQRITEMRSTLPPIRHVNCGMLPTASPAWKVAIEVLDPELGGWLHLHETILLPQMQERTNEIVHSVQVHFESLWPSQDSSTIPSVALNHVEKVKSAGPRLYHVVLDISVPSRCGPCIVAGPGCSQEMTHGSSCLQVVCPMPSHLTYSSIQAILKIYASSNRGTHPSRFNALDLTSQQQDLRKCFDPTDCSYEHDVLCNPICVSSPRKTDKFTFAPDLSLSFF